eukprot:CAMPEP_0170628016 /NCGR_PEP_ID=MMETSP0224-20130122/32390_1 /TAXON_ID=285029 /ORGANISM="Togula jolla, Strain CCCM 725" /LENGTH=38 /DNA_ID= /DNA_START= /DNA_END= /DNA_ORIENTATION=
MSLDGQSVQPSWQEALPPFRAQLARGPAPAAFCLEVKL